MEPPMTPNIIVILKQITKVGAITIPDFSLYYKAVIIKRVWYWHKNRYLDQWKTVETPELDPKKYGQLIFDKAGKNIQWKKDSFLNKCCWENSTAACRSMKLGQFLTPFTKINSNWMKDLNVRQDTFKTLDERAGNNFFDLGCSNFLLYMSLKTRELKAKMNYWDFIKITSFCNAKETINKTKRQPRERGKYLQMMCWIKG